MRSAAQLIAIDAFAIDTETTGLNPDRARIVEIAIVPISRGAPVPDDALRRLVKPFEPIPPSATAIHGIGDDAVASQPAFREIWPEFSRRLGSAPLVGHALGFDLAVIGRECARAGLARATAPALDVALLAQLLAPRLPGHSLEQIAAWLGAPIEGRHTALGDAMAAARIFCAMVPRLRAAGIRTLAEAQRACHAQGRAPATGPPAAWLRQEPPQVQDAESVPRIEAQLFRRRACEVMSGPARILPPETSLSVALSVMVRERVSSVFVAGPPPETAPIPAETGIVTERDAIRAIDAKGAAALETPIAALMSRPLQAVPARDFLYRAAARMDRLKIRHLGVTDEAGHLVGALSARDLLRSATGPAPALGDDIDTAPDVPALARAWSELHTIAKLLRGDGAEGRGVAAVISEELGRATAAAARIAERRLIEAGQGGAPCPFAVAILGSAGRGESLLALDQDNALVFAEGDPEGSEDRWFAELGRHLADILDGIGVPYCKGGTMASNAAWRGSLATWRRRIADWTRRTRPQDILAVDIFYDLRSVHGGAELALGIRREAFAAAAARADFAKLLVEAVGTPEPGLGLFGRVRTDESGRIDLKRSGLFGIVAAARALAVRHGIEEPATPDRLAAIKALRPEGEADLDGLIEAQGVFLDLILDQQIADIAAGLPASNAVAPDALPRRQRDRLTQALRNVQHLDSLARDLMF